MGFSKNGFDFYDPFHKNFQGRAAVGWWLACGACMVSMSFTTLPLAPFIWMAGLCCCAGVFRTAQGWQHWRDLSALKSRPLEFITSEELYDKIHGKALSRLPLWRRILRHFGFLPEDYLDPTHMWIGNGFIWEKSHAQLANLILAKDFHSSIADRNQERNMGYGFIHGLQDILHRPHEELFQPLKHVEGHTLIVGLPGTGKTRLFDLLISQAVMRNEPVIIIDPKGDKDMRDNTRRACRLAGHEDRFVYFHPAFPKESAAIDPLSNYGRVSELASRVSALMQGDGEAFKAFAWETVNLIANGLLICHDTPNLLKIRYYIENGFEGMVQKTIFSYLQRKADAGLIAAFRAEMDNAEGHYRNSSAAQRNTLEHFKAKLAAAFYRREVSLKYPCPEIDGLLKAFEHDATHYSKMIASFKPVIEMLTSDSLRELLSPDPLTCTRPIFDNETLISHQKVVVIGLDSLSDAQVGHMIGSIYLADLACVAGNRFNHMDPDKITPVNIFVDEVSEVLNQPFIQLLNKGRGAGFRLFAATQNISDFEAVLGKSADAKQVLGNINNKFALRTNDEATQKYLAEHMPSTTIQMLNRGQSHGGTADAPLAHAGHVTETLMQKESPLFVSQLFGMIPNMEYLAMLSGGMTIKGRIPFLTEDKSKKKRSVFSPAVRDDMARTKEDQQIGYDPGQEQLAPGGA